MQLVIEVTNYHQSTASITISDRMLGRQYLNVNIDSNDLIARMLVANIILRAIEKVVKGEE